MFKSKFLVKASVTITPQLSGCRRETCGLTHIFFFFLPVSYHRQEFLPFDHKVTQESFDDQERHGALDCDTGLTVRALTICAAVIQKQEWWCQKLGTLKIWRPDSFCAVQWPCGGSMEFFYRSVERFMPLPHGASVNICAWFLLPLPHCCHAATALLPHCRYVIIPATQTGFSVIIIRRKSKSLNENIENLWHLEPFLSVQFQTAALLTWCSCGGVVFFHGFFLGGRGDHKFCCDYNVTVRLIFVIIAGLFTPWIVCSFCVMHICHISWYRDWIWTCCVFHTCKTMGTFPW